MAPWKELRDRRLVQIVVGYVATGWLVLEGVDQFIDRGLLPELAYRLTLVAYLGGVPAAAVVGWFHGERGAQRVPKLEIALLATILLGTLGAGAVVYRDYEEAQRPGLAETSLYDLRRVAVLPFEDLSEDGELGYLADGLTESLHDRLDRVRQLDVVPLGGVRPYSRAAVTVDSIARAVRAGTVIEGSVEPEGRRADGGPRQVRVSIRLYDGESGARVPLPQEAFTVPAEELLAARDSLSSEIARGLRIWVGDELALREGRQGTGDLTAWTLLHRANRLRREGERRAAAHGAPEAAEAFRRADSLYALAARADTAWAAPPIERGWLAYRRSRLAHDRREIAGSVEAGLAHAGTALARAPRPSDPAHAEALELRGTLRYWKHVLHLVHDPAEQRALLASAVEDLEAAVERGPGLARAHAVLSHYHYTQRDLPAVLVSARTAYREDAYLDDADKVLWRLFLANYDLGQFHRASNWCQEARSRFPRHPQIALCPLYLLTAPTREPEVGTAWETYVRLDSLLPHGPHPYRNLGRMLVGAVLGRAGLVDSARTVLTSARLPTEHADLDPNLDLVALEAFARTRFGDRDTALALMRRYVAANHGFAPGEVRHWWWEELRGHPRFPELVTGAR